jgi:hypothetical protein
MVRAAVRECPNGSRTGASMIAALVVAWVSAL